MNNRELAEIDITPDVLFIKKEADGWQVFADE
jgi:hypothetical protein